MEKSAIISNSNLYRYELHRTWDIDKGEVLFIMLNPSTANAWKDDLTTIRCINFAKKWGYGGISIGNIYPFRAKRPKDLKKWLGGLAGVNFSQIGFARDTNEDHVRAMANEADITVCAWGCNNPRTPEWIDDLADEVPLYYLELCKDGRTPKHPLGNLSKDLVPRHYNLNTIIDG